MFPAGKPIALRSPAARKHGQLLSVAFLAGLKPRAYFRVRPCGHICRTHVRPLDACVAPLRAAVAETPVFNAPGSAR
jgi:hypothetical protein